MDGERHPHLHDRASPEATWRAVVKVWYRLLLARPGTRVPEGVLIGASLDAKQFATSVTWNCGDETNDNHPQGEFI